jgi:23S rRNA (guanosine2251-2'-O)-methyltransferase
MKSNPSESSEETVLVYGVHPTLEWLEQRADQLEEIWLLEHGRGNLKKVAHEAQKQGVLVRYRPKAFLDRQTPGKNHQGVIARRKAFEYTDFEELVEVEEGKPQALLLLVGIQDAGNLGALLRSAKGLGARGVVLSQRDTSAVTDAALKASAGAAATLPVAQVRNVKQAIRQLKDAGWWLLGLAPGGEQLPRFDLERPCVLILGAEGSGLKPSVQKQCDALLGIPMVDGWDSLNVSVSGGIALYEWRRQTHNF